MRQAFSRKGAALRGMGDYSKAADAYRSAIDYSHTSFASCSALAPMHRAVGVKHLARAHFPWHRRVITMDPDNAVAKAELAELEALLGRGRPLHRLAPALMCPPGVPTRLLMQAAQHVRPALALHLARLPPALVALSAGPLAAFARHLQLRRPSGRSGFRYGCSPHCSLHARSQGKTTLLAPTPTFSQAFRLCP